MKKIALSALTAFTIISAVAVSTQDAEARRWGRGAGIGLGILTAGAVIAAASGPRYTTQCGTVSRYNSYGEYRGERRVCRTVAY